jgi:hypothetical protein
MTIFWPAFIGGLVCVVLGVVVLVNRARLADANAGAQRAMFGKAGERVAQAGRQAVTMAQFSTVTDTHEDGPLHELGGGLADRRGGAVLGVPLGRT